MECEEQLLCRICLKTSKNGFEILNESIQNSLNLLLLKLNLGVSNNPLVCNCCIDSIKKCVSFKTKYLLKRDSTFIDGENVVSATKMCLSETITTDVSIDHSCCFCMESIDDKECILLRNEPKDVTVLLLKYFPEIIHGFIVTINSVVCTVCYQTLQHCLVFMSNCLTVEDMIKEYCQAEGRNKEDKIELNRVLYFMSKDRLQSNPNSYHATNAAESYGWEDIEGKSKVENEDFVEIEEQELLDIKNEDIKKETGENSCSRFDEFQNSQDHTNPEVYECEFCVYRSTSKCSLTRHRLTHKSLAEVTTYRYAVCECQAKSKSGMCSPMLNHSSQKAVYKCTMCTFETVYKDSLCTHMQTHKPTPEVMMYKCTFDETCVYETKCKANLSRHMLTHKRHAEVTIYKCEIGETCGFETKYKWSLLRHMVVHRKSPEVTMYKCEFDETCAYETKCKAYLHRHMVAHKRRAEVTMYKCEYDKMCSFETKYKYSLRKHMVAHRKSSEATMYKCEFSETCAYETKCEAYLRRHMLAHKKMYKCEFGETCAFETKYNESLRSHMLNCNNSSEVTVYKCELGEKCACQTRYEAFLRRHMPTHKKVTVYKCEFGETCAFETKYKNSLRSHMVTHQK